MAKLDHLYAEVATEQGGYVTARQARAYEVSAQLIAHHLKSGLLTRAGVGVYRFKWYPGWEREDVMAAWLAIGKEVAVVSHDSALDLWELGDVVPEGVHLTVPRSSRGVRGPAGVFIHTVSEVLLPAEVQVIQGMKVTSAARSIADYELNAGRPDQVATMLREAADRGLLLWSGITDVSPRRARALARVGLRAT